MLIAAHVCVRFFLEKIDSKMLIPKKLNILKYVWTNIAFLNLDFIIFSLNFL